MKEKRILRALGKVDEKYIEEAVPCKRTGRKYIWRKLAIIAACLSLLLALSAVAYAANWFGLRSLLLPIITGTSSNTDGENAAISLTGYQGSPEWQALAEWQAFVNEYDPNGTIFRATDGRLDASFARYSYYLVYSREMAEKMDAITAKYGLKLHTTSFDLQEYPEALKLLGDFMGDNGGRCSYMYEDGTFQVEGTVEFADIGAWDFQLLRSVRGTFHDAMLDIGDVSEYQEKIYETACGVPVTLALGKNRALILADLEDSFVTVHIPYGSDHGIKQSHLESLADSIDFSVLTPVEKPQIDERIQTAERDMEARKIYAATLRNLLYANTLPDGKKADLPVSTDSRFFVGDVDADGQEELVLLYNPGMMAGAGGYIIGYDTVTKEIDIQLEEFPAFSFLRNGNVKALSSHNQTWGGMWPYSLYQYLPESDSYELRGYVHSEDKKVFELNGAAERYPGYADVSGSGTVYYISADTWGTTPMDEVDYLAWLEANEGNIAELEIGYLPFTEENILAVEQETAARIIGKSAEAIVPFFREGTNNHKFQIYTGKGMIY